jgi:hypothetical protein
MARVVARAPTGIPARDSVTRQRFAPFQATPSGRKATAPEAARSPYRARAVRRRVSWRAHRPAYQPATALRASASRRFKPRLPGGRRPRQKPPEARTARAPSAGACRGARTAGRSRPQTRSAPALRARQRPERARSRQKPAARQKPGRRQPEARTARAPVRWRASWRAHRPAYQPATALRASASRRFNPRLPGGRRPRQKPPEARTARAPSAGACRGARTDRRTSPRQRYAPALHARNAPDASRKRLPRATSLQHNHRPGPDSTATPGHCVTATARAPVAPDDAGAQRRSSVAVAPPGHIVCTQVSCESASPFSFTSTQADTDAAHPAFTP